MVKIRQHLVPNRLAIVAKGTNACTYIAMHETANRGRGANANAHARLQAGGNSRAASWHYTVDDTEIVQSYLDTTRCWHAGNSTYALDAISIEICVNSDGNYDKALENAAALVAHLRKKHGIPANRVISHNFITGKNCPTIMLAEKRWDAFIAATDPAGSNKVDAGGSSKPGSSNTGGKAGGEWPTNALVVDGKFWLVTKRAYQRLLAPSNVGDYRGTIDGDIGPRTVKAEQRWLKSLGRYLGSIDGDRGARTVRALQRFLSAKGHYKGVVDGDHGSVTTRALQSYLNAQRKHYK